MHMHLVFFQILDRDGFTTDGGGNIIPDGNPQPPLAEENGWKDTAMVGPNEILRVIVRFEDYKGLYAYHCHILEHEDHEMMRQFVTIRGVALTMDDTVIQWPSVAGATGYDIVRGDLIALIGSEGDFALSTQACVLNGQPVNSYNHTGDPPLAAGEGYFYLSRTRDAIDRGTYDSGFSSQVDLRDAEVIASGNDCP